ncbi:RNA polymerase sigma factor [Streptacidiphilus sp. ASG 303]|uniref:RNA polymerase sigma factor n=1 Tax=Streptacidiphilus sp. ASG 303 TaxID=2896847 RepID=UPI001E4E159F|nr:RNA polymerase sigma factor [Streptacidiphilus sp. ASG 303]MCD0486084.1 RNA polymerase sigma factor [Streptacidiphilus sp. ASG 303]
MESFLPSQQNPTGDRRAFAALFDEHARTVHAHAARATGDGNTADDVVSLTFLEAWRLRDRLRGDVVNPRAWLLGIATNVLRNTARAARRHRAAMSRLPPREPVPDFADEVVGRIADAATAAAAVAALGRLRRSEREVFTLVVWSGLGYAEAAQALGIPVGTVRSRLSRARDRLRRTVAAQGPPERGAREPDRGRGHHVHDSRSSMRSHPGRQP